jgi:hypothetical protein
MVLFAQRMVNENEIVGAIAQAMKRKDTTAENRVNIDAIDLRLISRLSEHPSNEQ